MVFGSQVLTFGGQNLKNDGLFKYSNFNNYEIFFRESFGGRLVVFGSQLLSFGSQN